MRRSAWPLDSTRGDLMSIQVAEDLGSLLREPSNNMPCK